MTDFITDLGSFSISCHQSLQPDEARAIKGGIGEKFPASAEKISAIRADRYSSNDPSSRRLSPVIPYELAKVVPRCFNKVLLGQNQRLECSGQSLHKPERDSCSFKAAVNSENYLLD